MEIKKEYQKIITKNEELRGAIETIKASEEQNDKEIKQAYNNITNWKERTEEQTKRLEELSNEEKRLQTSKKEVETMQQLLINNLLFIQQELLKEASQLLKTSKYYKKPFGEKTKEKMQEEIKEALINKYNINIYLYINQSMEYNRENEHNYEQCYEISLYYEDFYYIYETKQEKIRVFDNSTYFYYWGDNTRYININNLENESKKIIDKYNKSMGKIEKLNKQIEEIRQENNKKIIGSLRNNYYIEYRR